MLCGLCGDARRVYVAGYEASEGRLHVLAARRAPGEPDGRRGASERGVSERAASDRESSECDSPSRRADMRPPPTPSLQQQAPLVMRPPTAIPRPPAAAPSTAAPSAAALSAAAVRPTSAARGAGRWREGDIDFYNDE